MWPWCELSLIAQGVFTIVVVVIVMIINISSSRSGHSIRKHCSIVVF